jgi:alkylhydroperoxidase family enzyme
VLLGRAAGLTEAQLAHIADDPLPDGVYDAAGEAVVRYAQRSTRLEPIDGATYGALAEHFTDQQMIEICFTVGLSNMINRFHATFLTDLDPATGEALAHACPLPFPDLDELSEVDDPG